MFLLFYLNDLIIVMTVSCTKAVVLELQLDSRAISTERVCVCVCLFPVIHVHTYSERVCVCVCLFPVIPVHTVNVCVFVCVYFQLYMYIQ